MKFSSSSLFLASCFGFFLLVLSFSACDEPEPEPAYLIVEGAIDPNTGETDEDLAIFEVWLFVDSVFLGAYDLPARIPILTTGSATIELSWGIRQDGRSQVPEAYPFYTTIVQTLDLIPGNTINLGTLPVTYTSETNIIINEDFEPGGQPAFPIILTGTGGIQVSTQDVYQGQGSGKITLTEANPTVEVASRESFTGLTDQMRGNVWIEINFRSDVPVIWGVTGVLPGMGFSRFYDPGFVASTRWQKIYLNVTAPVGTSTLEAYNFGLFTTLNGTELTEANVFLDNIKVLYL